MEGTYTPIGQNRVERHRAQNAKQSRSILLGVAGVFVLMLVLGLVYVIVNFFTPSAEGEASISTQHFTASPPKSQTQTATTEAITWPMTEGDYDNNRWFGEGIREIKDAITEADAVEAANVWLDAVKRDPTLLKAAALTFLDEEVTKEDLVDAEGMASEKAVDLTSRIELELAQSEISPDNAPEDAYNSGVSGGDVVSAATPGISGDRKAVRIINKDGENFWVMGRCGNIAVEGQPCYPTGPTDQPPVKPKPKPKPPQKAPDTTNGAARQPLRDENAVRTPTPGYPGQAEEIVQNQESQPQGGTEPTPYGTPGTGTGDGAITPPSSNSSGETNSGGGQSDPIPPPGGTNTGCLPEID